ncbi:hypothetical protein KFK09_013456 [Dendrobium nobile]|uniref:Uncharacterized protein n=1 Tax=Dendrobium nobile TaxID=94219 RepID=A0A8T3B8U0_DENNO|nr:hypothetical protein KFK09_013456 [Dendrobium nobile]
MYLVSVREFISYAENSYLMQIQPESSLRWPCSQHFHREPLPMKFLMENEEAEMTRLSISHAIAYQVRNCIQGLCDRARGRGGEHSSQYEDGFGAEKSLYGRREEW